MEAKCSRIDGLADCPANHREQDKSNLNVGERNRTDTEERQSGDNLVGFKAQTKVLAGSLPLTDSIHSKHTYLTPTPQPIQPLTYQRVIHEAKPASTAMAPETGDGERSRRKRKKAFHRCHEFYIQLHLELSASDAPPSQV